MLTIQVFLILLSGLCVLHGLLVALFLWFYPVGLRQANRLLSALLLVLSFRVGKSVLLAFDKEIQMPLIFAGLAALLLVGPLFYLYARSVLEKSLHLSGRHLLHFVPFCGGLAFSAWTTQQNVSRTPVAIFIGLFALY